jgi:hypothetical protein
MREAITHFIDLNYNKHFISYVSLFESTNAKNYHGLLGILNNVLSYLKTQFPDKGLDELSKEVATYVVETLQVVGNEEPLLKEEGMTTFFLQSLEAFYSHKAHNEELDRNYLCSKALYQCYFNRFKSKTFQPSKRAPSIAEFAFKRKVLYQNWITQIQEQNVKESFSTHIEINKAFAEFFQKKTYGADDKYELNYFFHKFSAELSIDKSSARSLVIFLRLQLAIQEASLNAIDEFNSYIDSDQSIFIDTSLKKLVEKKVSSFLQESASYMKSIERFLEEVLVYIGEGEKEDFVTWADRGLSVVLDDTNQLIAINDLILDVIKVVYLKFLTTCKKPVASSKLKLPSFLSFFSSDQSTDEQLEQNSPEPFSLDDLISGMMKGSIDSSGLVTALEKLKKTELPPSAYEFLNHFMRFLEIQAKRDDLGIESSAAPAEFDDGGASDYSCN